jgi:DNA-binding response OmpR family regulator
VKILLIEDNNDLALNILDFFQSSGHIMDYSGDGLTGLNLALRNRYDAILLDIMIPGIDGYKFCEQLREKATRNIPIIMLTAKDSERDKLKGFELGTDDYVVKPFSLLELEARVHAVVRREKQYLLGNRKLVFENLVYDPAKMVLKCAAAKLSLKPVPLKILVLLMQNPDRIVTRQEIEEEVWNDDPPDSEVLRSHVYAIRKELEIHSVDNFLQTIRGVGYMLSRNER